MCGRAIGGGSSSGGEADLPRPVVRPHILRRRRRPRPAALLLATTTMALCGTKLLVAVPAARAFAARRAPFGSAAAAFAAAGSDSHRQCRHQYQPPRCGWQPEGRRQQQQRPIGIMPALLSSRRRDLSVLMTAGDEDEVDEELTKKSAESTWDTAGLKREVQRLILRCHKKVGKAHQRLAKAKDRASELAENPDATLEELENCPDVESLEMELGELQERLRGLNELEESLQKVSKKRAVLPSDVAALAIDLGVDDKPPPRPARGPTKKKGPRSQLRLPYRRYYTVGGVEIRVGKKAPDNDELSLNPEHRDGSDWWMHASGCPGSHVVIRFGEGNLPKEAKLDAAALAARHSKCHGGTVKVSLTRCRDVKKPAGAKAGLVQLTGRVETVSVDMKEAQARLDRLDATVLVN